MGTQSHVVTAPNCRTYLYAGAWTSSVANEPTLTTCPGQIGKGLCSQTQETPILPHVHFLVFDCLLKTFTYTIPNMPSHNTGF